MTSIVRFLSLKVNPDRELIRAAARKPELRSVKDGRFLKVAVVCQQF
jgi:hypothetical protein